MLFCFWLLGFLAFRFLVGFAAFGGFLALAFRILCIPSSSPAGGVLVFAAFRWFMRCWFLHPLLFQFLSGLFGFCTLSLVSGFGLPHPPASVLYIYVYVCLHVCMSVCMHFFEHHGEAPPPPTPPPPPPLLFFFNCILESLHPYN